MAENKTDQIFRNVLGLISKNVAKTKKLHKSNSLLHKTSNLNVNSQSSLTEWYNRLLVAFMFLLKLLKEISRITIITKPKTLSFSALNMSEHNASFERESLLKYQSFFQMVPLHRCRCRWKLLQTQVVFHQDTIDKYQ